MALFLFELPFFIERHNFIGLAEHFRNGQDHIGEWV